MIPTGLYTWQRYSIHINWAGST